MIVGTGIDIVEIARIEKILNAHKKTFVEKVFTENERNAAEKFANPLTYYSGRWAAKEAVVKALGTGFGSQCGWQDVDINNDENGKPVVTLTGTGLNTSNKLGISSLHLSISHERSYACAMVIAEIV